MDGEARHGASAAERSGALGTAGPEEAERAAADDRDAAAAAAVGSGADQDARLAGEASLDERPDHGADARARRPLARSTEAREAQQAAEQWLRRIPDDPAELLRQKLRYQYRARRDDPEALVGGEPW
jgi:Ca-activated chloride channel family protein